MTERKFSRSFDMPTVNPDQEDESPYSGRGNKIAANYKVSEVDFANRKCPIKCPIIEEDKECNHKWKSYMGLNEQFDFCTVCDEKRSM